MKQIYILLTLILLTSCNNSPQPSQIDHSEITELKAKIENLKKQLDECENGADKLLSRANLLFDQGEFARSKSNITMLLEKYPTSPEAERGKKLQPSIDSEIEELALKKKKEELNKKRKEEQRLADATSKMRRKVDDMNGVTWYHDKTSPRYTNQNGFFAYIGTIDDTHPWLRIAIQYKADDWLFIERYIIKVDDKTYTIEENKYGEIQTDNGNGGIWEWLDRAVDQKEMEIIRAVATGKNVKIRYVGKHYHKDRTITSSEKRALRNVLDAYEVLGGNV